MPDIKKNAIAIILIILIIAFAIVWVSIFGLNKQEELKESQKQPQEAEKTLTREETLKSFTAPAETTQTAQERKELEKAMKLFVAPASKRGTVTITKEILDSFTAPQ